jgi:proteic killer suppression protein
VAVVDLTRVHKSLHKLPNYVVLKLYRWVDGVEKEGIMLMRQIPGYHDEPLKGKWVGYRSIRLSRSYRAIYSEKLNSEFTILLVEEVNKHEY